VKTATDCPWQEGRCVSNLCRLHDEALTSEISPSGVIWGMDGYADTMAADKNLHQGDKVEWKTHGTTTSGAVEEKITEDTEAAGRTVRASEDDPQYRVRSDKSGKDAVHKPDALKPKKD
jgi:hypothetical protein